MRPVVSCMTAMQAVCWPSASVIRATVLDDGRQLPDIPEPDPSEVARIPRDVLMGFVSELPDGYRTVFNLYCIEGYSHRDIAQMLGINEKSSSSQLFRARALLARRIGAYMETH